MTKKYIYVSAISFSLVYVGAATLNSAEAGRLSNALYAAHGSITSSFNAFRSTLRAHLSTLKNAGKTTFTLLNGTRREVLSFLYNNSPTVIQASFDKIESTYRTAVDPKAHKAVRYLIDHRDIIEKVIIAGLKNGKTIADIGLDIAGFVPVAGTGALAMKLALDFILPVFTAALQAAFARDQENMMRERAGRQS